MPPADPADSKHPFPPPPFYRPCLAALNAAMVAHAHAYGAIVVRSRTTITRRAAADLAPRLAPPPPPAPRPAHSVLAAALLTSAFATGGDGGPVCPDAAASLFEIETPPFLASFAAAWAGGAPTLRLLCLHGYLRGQPPCGPGHGLGEERAAWGGVGGAPARTAFVLVPP